MPLSFPASPSVNDTFTSGARTWTWSGTIWEITGSIAAAGSVGPAELAANAVTSAKLATSISLTGTPLAPTAAAATNTTQIATTQFVRTEVSNLVGTAGATLDTLGELATALGNDAALSTTLTTSIGLKAPLASPTFTGAPLAPTPSTGTNTTQIATTAFVAEAIPVASLQMFAGAVTQTVSSGVVTTTAPSGWLLCNGNAVSRTTYSTLFASVSTTYGVGDGTTTFNLPDMRSRMPIGTGTGTGLTARTLAGAGGVETVTLTSAQSGLPAHSHANTVTNNTVTTNVVGNHTHYADGGAFSGSTQYTSAWTGEGARRETSGGGAHDHTVTSNVTISNVANTAANAASAHDNMSPYLGVNFIIKAL